MREQIRFSAPGETVPSPTDRLRDDLPSKPFEFLDRGNSISGVVAPMVAPSPSAVPNNAHNARLLEAWDQKKNWVYGRSEDFNKSQTVEEMFGVRDTAASEKKPRTALENYFEERDQKPGRNRVREATAEWNRPDEKKDYDFGSSFKRDGKMSESAGVRSESPFDSQRPLTAGFSLPTDIFGSSPNQGRLNGFQNTGMNNPLSRGSEQQNRQDDFRKLLVVPGSINPLAPNFDPLNLHVDTTRQEMNPAAAQRLGDLPGSAGDALNPLRSPAGPAGSASTLLGSPAANVLGPSSLSPAVAAPAETRYVQPSPTVLEFPKRKF